MFVYLRNLETFHLGTCWLSLTSPDLFVVPLFMDFSQDFLQHSHPNNNTAKQQIT